MNEHEATALLEGLVDQLEVGPPPTQALVVRGRRTQARRTAMTVLGATAAVAVTMGGVAVVAGTERDSSPGPYHPATTSTAPTHPPLRDLDGDDLLGFWQPVTVLGETVSGRGHVGNLQFRRSEVVTQHGCAIFTAGTGSASVVRSSSAGWTSAR